MSPAFNSSPGDTIAAIATPPGRGAIAIIRVSGPGALAIASALFEGGRDPREMPGFSASRGWIVSEGRRLDEVLCLVMRGPKSYTGEDVAEFHCHGGTETARQVLSAVLRAGALLAPPGEFTRRAFLAGRIDLAQAEAVAALISGETEAAARAAAEQLEGALSRELADLRDRLAETLALVEAGIDFSEEDDVIAIASPELRERLAAAAGRLAALVADSGRGRRLFEGARVVIAGKPNVGKSTLMNALLRSDRVIVSAEPGTTRDVVEEKIDLGGVPVRLCDTAGLRLAASDLEREGVDRARHALDLADLTLLVLDGSAELTAEDQEALRAARPPVIRVINKMDRRRMHLVDGREDCPDLAPHAGPGPAVMISAREGTGLEELEAAVAREFLGQSTAAPAVVSARHGEALGQALDNLSHAIAAIDGKLSHEFAAAGIRAALDAIGLVTGETATEEILDRIFSRFCVGK